MDDPLGAVDARVGRHPFDCAVCLAQNGADFYKNYGLSEWDADISDNDTDLNSNAQVISQGYRIRGLDSTVSTVLKSLQSIYT